MTAAYPSSIQTHFINHVNNTEIIDASHPNTIQAEVVAIETTVGIIPATTVFPSSGFSSAAGNSGITTVASRLTNIEAGVIGDAHNQYIRKTADSTNTIVPGSTSTIGLAIQASSGQTAHLQEWRNSSGTVISYVDANGNFTAASSASAGVQDVFMLMGA